MASLFHYLWVESPHRDRHQSAKSWGCGGKAPALGHSPALFHQTAGAFSFSIAMQQDGTTPAPQIASAFRSGAPFYNALTARCPFRGEVSLILVADGSGRWSPVVDRGGYW